MHIIGGSGSGKTTLMFNLLRQDLESGAGFALLDPHGDLVDKVLGAIPPERMEDVILLDPSDEQFVVPFQLPFRPQRL
jgi:DNA helicase HerA-like ATPase